MESYKKLLLANQLWASEKTQHNPQYFSELAKDQKPEFLWISCADSRVPAETITGVSPGSLFVHRNIANLVVHDDLNFSSVLHYAVSFLKVKHIVVCGHFGCGGVLGAISGADLGIINGWVKPIRKLAEDNHSLLKDLTHQEARVNRVVELNVKKQIETLSEHPLIKETWAAEKRPMLHGWVYDLRTGLLEEIVRRDPRG